MKKLFFLLLIIAASVYAYFWYIRGINLLAREDANPLPLYGMATRLPEKTTDYRWFAGTEMPTPRAGVATATVDTFIYVIGGYDGFSRTSNAVEMYNASNDAWTTLRAMPRGVQNASAVAVGNKIYVIGGAEGLAEKAVSSVQIYDIASNTWSLGKNRAVSVSGAAAVLHDGLIHVLGGNAGGSLLSTHAIYDPARDAWSEGEPMNAARERASAVVLGKDIYVFGGREGSLAYNMDSVEVYDTARETWDPVALMPRKRSDMAVVAWNGKAYVFGGEAPTVTFDTIDVYSPDTNSWASLGTKLPHARHGLAGAAVRGTFFLIGGGARPGISVSSLNDVLQSPAAPAPKAAE